MSLDCGRLAATLALVLSLTAVSTAAPPDGSAAATIRDDAANVEIVRALNRALENVPFSTEFEGVLDDCPFRIEWSTGPDLPFPWKGGISGVFGEDVVLTGGSWGDDKPHTFVYNVRNRTYTDIVPSPVMTSFTQGGADEEGVYLVAGKSAGDMVARLRRDSAGDWAWKQLAPAPEANRWTGSVAATGKWLVLFGGMYTGKGTPPREYPAWRLRLDRPDSRWEAMAPYPGGGRAVITTAVAGGCVYAFGGWTVNAEIDAVIKELDPWGRFKFPKTAFPTVISKRDAYRYDPKADTWTRLRNLPFSMIAGKGIAWDDRHILLMGTNETKTVRIGKSHPAGAPYLDQYWKGYDDRVLCYDIRNDNYSRVGVMLYGVSSWNWARVGDQVLGFGGEPYTGQNSNRENVLQIGTVSPRR